MLYPTGLPTRVELRMNVVRGLAMQKQMGGIQNIFVFAISFKKKKTMLYGIYCHFITWICSILPNVFVPSCPMYWWSVSSDSMLLNPTKKKNAWLLGKKSLCLCAYGLVFQPILRLSLCFHLIPHKFCHLSNEAIPVLSRFFWFCFVQLIDPLKANKRKELAYFVL